MSATGKLDRPGGSLHFEIIDATPPWAGDAPLIVFHHGIGATADVWAEWQPAVLASGSEAFSLPIVGWVLRVNLLSLAGLLVLYRLAVWIGLVTREPLGAREIVTAG